MPVSEIMHFPRTTTGYQISNRRDRTTLVFESFFGGRHPQKSIRIIFGETIFGPTIVDAIFVLGTFEMTTAYQISAESDDNLKIG